MTGTYSQRRIWAICQSDAASSMLSEVESARMMEDEEGSSNPPGESLKRYPFSSGSGTLPVADTYISQEDGLPRCSMKEAHEFSIDATLLKLG